jgi:proteasome lid subunit RPN8/RPN11
MDWQELEPLQPEQLSVDAVLLPVDAVRWKSSLDISVVLHAHCLKQMEEHAASSSNEVIGILRGRVIEGGQRTLTIAMRAEPLQHAQGSRVSVQATLASWQQAWGSMQERLVVVGWYHSHPGFGVFFSETDRVCQQHFFRQPWQVGMVLDPHSGEAGAFLGAESDVAGWMQVEGVR